MASQPKTFKPLKLMSYEFPGDEAQSWTVVPMTVGSLLDNEKIIIPIFQRSYCWTDDQIHGWWRDILTADEQPGIAPGHRIGRLLFKRQATTTTKATASASTSPLICIDGQQRITTSLLFVAAIRDAALRHLSGCSEAAERQALSELVERLDGVLFIDRQALESWESEAVKASALADVLAVGQELPFFRLAPSYVDRAPFFELVLLARLNSNRAKEGTGDHLFEIREATRRSVQYRTKSYFDAQIDAWLTHRLSSSSSSSALSASSSLSFLTKRMLTFFTIMYMECLSSISLPQLFLWLQEKSLFSMGALLFNPSPGVLFRAGDMVRNLLLSAFSDLDPQQVEKIYVDRWVQPFESKFESYRDMDIFFRCFVEHNKCPHKGPFEQSLIDMAPMLKAHKMEVNPNAGAGLFARYHSIFDLQAQTTPIGPDLSLGLLDQLAQFASLSAQPTATQDD